jgi:expansin (peptidoglycan-binding protein)
MALNKRTSSLRNLGIFASLIALISTTSPGYSGEALFNEPAMLSTDLTALNPKS